MNGAGKSPERDARGRLLPGHHSPGPGRIPLPDWLRGKGEDLVRLQLRAALEGVMPRGKDKEGNEILEPVETKDRLVALEKLVDRIYGKAPQAVDVSGGEALTAAGAALLALAQKKG